MSRRVTNHELRIANCESRIANCESRITNYDIYLVGVGGQGVLTIGELVAEASHRRGMPVNFYPTKGMAQRGGFVKAQLRLGREMVGPNIPEKGADLVIAMELSEALKAVRFIKPGGDFVLFGHVWAPTAVMLGKADYPTLAMVREQVQEAGGKMCYIAPERGLQDRNGLGSGLQDSNGLGTREAGGEAHYIAGSLPLYQGAPVPANIFVLGVAIGHTRLGEVLDPSEMAHVVQTRWAKGAERNAFAFQAGLEATIQGS